MQPPTRRYPSVLWEDAVQFIMKKRMLRKIAALKLLSLMYAVVRNKKAGRDGISVHVMKAYGACQLYAPEALPPHFVPHGKTSQHPLNRMVG